MAENTKIEWCHHTFNPWRGCTKVSPGCENCYAETMSGRNPKVLGVWGPSGTRVVAAKAQWKLPVKWDREAKAAGVRARVFCASLADVFEDWNGRMCDSQGRVLYWDQDDLTLCATTAENGDVDGEYRNVATMADFRKRLFALVDTTPNLDWLLLTKRPENVARMMPEFNGVPSGDQYQVSGGNGALRLDVVRLNVWLGVSVEDRKYGLPRVDILRKLPAAVRFLSVEPLLEDIGEIDLTGIHWVIVGGESGAMARPLQIGWLRSIVRQCRATGIAVFVKQLGRRPLTEAVFGNVLYSVSLIDRKGGDIAEFPEALRVREFPQ